MRVCDVCGRWDLSKGFIPSSTSTFIPSSIRWSFSTQSIHYLCTPLRSVHSMDHSITLLHSQRCWHNLCLCLSSIINTQETHIQLPSPFTQIGISSMAYTKYIKPSQVLHDSTQASLTRISNQEILPSHLTIELKSNNDSSQSSSVRAYMHTVAIHGTTKQSPGLFKHIIHKMQRTINTLYVESAIFINIMKTIHASFQKP